MIRNLPTDLIDAVELLKSFEKSDYHSKRTRDFKDAIEILNNHLRTTPDTSHKQFVENLKRTYTRKLLEQIPSLFTLDIDDWFDYCKLLLMSVPNETGELSKKDPHLGQNAKKFIGTWKEEAIATLQRISERDK